MGTTRGIPYTTVRVGGSDWYASMFATPVTLVGGNVYSVTGSNSAADDSTHFYTVFKYTLHNDANSRALLPFGGMTFVNYTAGAWSAPVNTAAVPFVLYLNTGGEWSLGGGATIHGR